MGITADYAYDANGNLVRYDNFNNEWMKYEYDVMGRRIKEVMEQNHSQNWQYDLAGNVVSHLDGNRKETSYTYDKLHRVTRETDGEGGYLAYTYNALGAVSSIETPGGGGTPAVTRYTYDLSGNVLTEADPLGAVTTYSYDGMGNALTLRDENGVETDYVYDERSQLVQETSPDGISTYTYDKVGNIRSAANEAGTVQFSYDNLHRLAETTYEDGISTLRYQYDENGNRTGTVYPDGTAVTVIYDAQNNPVSISDDGVLQVAYTRDYEGRIKKESFLDGSTTEYGYNSTGQLVSQLEVNPQHGTRREIAYTYYENGNLKSEQRSGVNVNLDDESLWCYYDDANQLIEVKKEGQSTHYRYDQAGNLLSDGESTYAYNAKNQLVQKVTSGKTTAYTYDAAGNLTEETGPDGTVTYRYDAKNKLVEGVTSEGERSTYTYNALGVRIGNEQVRKNENAGHQNQLLMGGSEWIPDYHKYLLDGRYDWQRVYETEVGTTVQNDNETVTKHYITDYRSLANRDMMVIEDGSFVQKYVYDENSARLSAEFRCAEGTSRGEGGENLASDVAAGKIEKVWYRRSLLDSSLFVVDKTGEVLAHMVYDSWGLPEVETYIGASLAGIDNLNNYTGYTWDETLGLYFAQNRFYDSRTHRFTQEDPVKDGMNWYGYVANNPGVFVDVTGKAYVPLRTTAEAAGFSVYYCDGTASVLRPSSGYIDVGITFSYGDQYGTFNDNGIMMVDDLRLDNFLYAPNGPVYIKYYSKMEDEYGKFILRNWLNGDGSDVSFSGGQWGDYIAKNPNVQEKLYNLAMQAINNGSMTIKTTTSVTLAGYGGYLSGYQLLNGSNQGAGGFQVTGIVAKVDGVYWADVQFVFNDIIDPNPEYRSDELLAAIAKLMQYKCNDYKISISGSYRFKI